jgi:nifR3 family TIM-barrel protein
MNFWENLKKPIMVLAPMADVTDPAFRRIIAKYGKPDVTWTEFVSSDGLFMGGYEALVKDLAFTEAERPIVAQFFGSNIENMRKAAELACDLGFDGIDINMGCPDKSIEKQGAGAAHIKNPKHTQEIIYAVMEGAKKDGKNLPVSIKTRIGYNKNELETWLPAILETNPALVTIHARTRKEMSLVPARWEHVERAVEIRNEFIDSKGRKSETLIFGNGDVVDLDDTKKRVEETGCDGVMLGRAIFGNPWLFSIATKLENISIPEKLKVMVEHTKLFEEILPHKNFAIMKKHYKAYVNGFDGAKELRMKLMEAINATEVEKIITEYLS